MKKFFKKFLNKNGHDKTYNTIEELDQHLHEITMQQIEDNNNGLPLQRQIKVKISNELRNKIGDEKIFDLLMMKAIHRAMVMKASNPDNLYVDEFPSKSNESINDNYERQAKQRSICSLLTEDKETVH